VIANNTGRNEKENILKASKEYNGNKKNSHLYKVVKIGNLGE